MEPQQTGSGAVFLQTPRLTLRHFTAEDVPAMFALNSDPVVMQFIGPAETMEQSKATIQRVLLRYQERPGTGAWMTQRTMDGAFLGFHLLKQLDTSGHTEVGYRLFPRYWGQGYATEAAHALLEHGFGGLGLSRIVGITHPDNRASQRVLMKLGMDYRRMDHFYGVDVTFFDVDLATFRQRKAVTPG